MQDDGIKIKQGVRRELCGVALDLRIIMAFFLRLLAFFRFFKHFGLQNGLQSNIAAVPKPVFYAFRPKMLLYFLRFSALQRNEKVLRRGDSNLHYLFLRTASLAALKTAPYFFFSEFRQAM